MKFSFIFHGRSCGEKIAAWMMMGNDG